MTQKNYDIFHELRNKNVTDETILICLKEKIQESNNILDITKYNKNLLFISTLYDNSNAFSFFAKNFEKDFSPYFKESILFIYPNKNPDILKISFQNLKNITEDDKTIFINSFSRNCYREENIEIVQNWLFDNISETQRNLFISKLIENNNTPFLRHISKKINWKKDLINQIKILGKDKDLFFISLINEKISEKKEQDENKEISLNSESAKIINIPMNTIKKNKVNETTIIVKKKKTN